MSQFVLTCTRCGAERKRRDMSVALLVVTAEYGHTGRRYFNDLCEECLASLELAWVTWISGEET